MGGWRNGRRDGLKNRWALPVRVRLPLRLFWNLAYAVCSIRIARYEKI